MKQEMMGWQWHQLDHTRIICTSLQTDDHASISPLNHTTIKTTDELRNIGDAAYAMGHAAAEACTVHSGWLQGVALTGIR